MHRIGLARSFAPNQILPAFIAVLSCSLSLWLTLKFCRQLWPEQTGVELVGLGITWEASKLYFGPHGLQGIFRGAFKQRLGGLFLLSLCITLAAGSVAASLGYLVQTDSREQTRALASSRAYRSAEKKLAALDAQIGNLSASAQRDVAENFRSRALRTAAHLDALQSKRDATEAQLQRLEVQPAQAEGSDFFQQIGALFPGQALQNAKRIKLAAHGVIAVMLELISLTTLFLLQSSQAAAAANQHQPPQVQPGTPAGTRLHAIPRTDFGARVPAPRRGTEQDDTGTPGLRTDFGAKVPAPLSRAGQGDTDVLDPHKSTRYQAAKDLIASAELEPTYRELKRTLAISQGTAQRFLAAMQSEGFLQRVGRKYQVARLA